MTFSSPEIGEPYGSIPSSLSPCTVKNSAENELLFGSFWAVKQMDTVIFLKTVYLLHLPHWKMGT